MTSTASVLPVQPSAGVDFGPICRWVLAREEIRKRKESGAPPPWTDDPILARFRFCNVRREDDRVTRWISGHVRGPHRDHPLLWLMMCACRVINWPDTLSQMILEKAWPGLRPDWVDRACAVLQERRARGEKVYTGAYVVPAPSLRGADKQDYVCQTVLGSLDRAREQLASAWEGRTLQETHRWLRQWHGWGDFLAYQAVVDMRFCDRLLSEAPDRDTWAAAGPGTIRGLHRLRGRPLQSFLSQAEALPQVLEVYRAVRSRTGVDLDLSDAPNVLCEFDKYERVRLGEGRPRALYVPGRGC